MNSTETKIKVMLFAAAREIAGRDVIELSLSAGDSVASLRQRLIQAEPRLKVMASSLLWAVNNSYAGDHQILTGTETVACFPPVSGG
jgi:molybdopterin converting factor subunit 1